MLCGPSLGRTRAGMSRQAAHILSPTSELFARPRRIDPQGLYQFLLDARGPCLALTCPLLLKLLASILTVECNQEDPFLSEPHRPGSRDHPSSCARVNFASSSVAGPAPRPPHSPSVGNYGKRALSLEQKRVIGCSDASMLSTVPTAAS